jgi:hypothetical protein
MLYDQLFFWTWIMCGIASALFAARVIWKTWRNGRMALEYQCACCNYTLRDHESANCPECGSKIEVSGIWPAAIPRIRGERIIPSIVFCLILWWPLHYWLGRVWLRYVTWQANRNIVLDSSPLGSVSTHEHGWRTPWSSEKRDSATVDDIFITISHDSRTASITWQRKTQLWTIEPPDHTRSTRLGTLLPSDIAPCFDGLDVSPEDIDGLRTYLNKVAASTVTHNVFIPYFNEDHPHGTGLYSNGGSGDARSAGLDLGDYSGFLALTLFAVFLPLIVRDSSLPIRGTDARELIAPRRIPAP